MMIWNASGVPVWQVAFVWAGVILFWGFVIWAGYAHITRRRYRRWRPHWDAGRVNGHRGTRGGDRTGTDLNERHIRYPQCTGGRRAGPPEDRDGPWAYLERTQPHLVLDAIVRARSRPSASCGAVPAGWSTC